MDIATAARRSERNRAPQLLLLGASTLLLAIVAVVALAPAGRTLDVLAVIAGALSALGLLWLARQRRRSP